MYWRDSPVESGGLLDTPATGADSSSTSSEHLNNMSRLNGRVHHTGTSHNPVQYQPVPTQYSGQVLPPYQDNITHRDDYEPSCLVRTPSGNVYIPSEDIPKNSTLDYKQGIHSPNIHSPIKGDQKAMESYNTHFGSNIGLPVVPLRNNLRRPGGPSPPSSYEAGMNDRGGGVPRRHLPLHQHRGVIPFCSWRCTAIVFITIAFVLAALLAFFTARSALSLPISGDGCGVIVNEASSVSDEAQIGDLSPTREHQQRPQQTIPPDGTTFKMVELGHKLKHKIAPYGYWNMQFYQPESAYVKFEVAVPRGASLGIYGRRNALPTHTSYDFLQVLSGYKVGTGRNARSSLAPTQIETLVKYLDQGHWFLSVYNDDGDPQELSLGAHVSSEYTEGCPKGCSNNGDCILGSCQCYPGFTGPDCTQMKCPVLCSGNGEYREGNCICRPGWKGQECSVRHDECEVPDCNGHGHCVDGRCMCAKGFKGQFCEDVDCPHPLCSGHGWCVNGTCICQKGWRGPDCARMDDAALQCLPDCSGHGHFDLVGQQCVCEPEWTGSECNKRVCGLDCGYHGRCEGGHCLCFAGWTGDRCDLMICDLRINLDNQILIIDIKVFNFKFQLIHDTNGIYFKLTFGEGNCRLFYVLNHPTE